MKVSYSLKLFFVILIISEDLDNLTDHVISYLAKYEIDTVRINSSSLVSIEYQKNLHEFIIDGKRSFNFSELSLIWYRRGFIRAPISNISTPDLSHILREDWSIIVNHLLHRAAQMNMLIGSFEKEISGNKLIDLETAKAVGFATPDTVILSSKIKLQQFISKKGRVITKSLNNLNHFSISENQRMSCIGTRLISKELMKNIPLDFYPSVFQEYIEKEFEIRIFVFLNRVFSFSIFSQSDNGTKIDYRNYNLNKMNRYVPYTLPKQVEAKIVDFFSISKLNTGSVDLILDKKGRYVFLEVNPCGQVEGISTLCNLNIGKEIALVFKALLAKSKNGLLNSMMLLLIPLFSFCQNKNSDTKEVNYFVVSDKGDQQDKCLNIVDGRIVNETVHKLGNEEITFIADSAVLRAMPIHKRISCVIMVTTPYLPIETYIYGQLGRKSFQDYKIPIIINKKYGTTFSELKALTKESIKCIGFLPVQLARERYDPLIVFGAVEVTTY